MQQSTKQMVCSLSKARTHFGRACPIVREKVFEGFEEIPPPKKPRTQRLPKITCNWIPTVKEDEPTTTKNKPKQQIAIRIERTKPKQWRKLTIEQQRYQQNSFRTPQSRWAENNNLAAKIQAQKEMASDVSFQALTLQQKAKNLTEQSSSDSQQIIEKMADLLNKPIELFMGTMNKILRNEFSISSVPTDKQQEKRQKISTNNACYVHWRKSILHEYTGCHRTKTVSSNTTTATTTTTTTTTTKQTTNK